MDRAQLFDALSHLSSQDFERLLVAVNMPRMNRAGASAKIGEQVSAFLEWTDSNLGPGLEAIARYLAELNCFEFDAYLRSLIATYEKWWEHYTLTDAIGKVEQAQPEKPSVFDFGLMVQTVTKEREPTDPENNLLQQDKEKTERLPVLEGIRKYADDHVLLVGRPGSGKSTALIRLLLEEAALSPGPSPDLGRGEQKRIPVLVELRYWQTSVLERIRAFLYQHDPHLNLDNAALNALLRQGRFLLLIDGLNELPSDEARTQLATFRRDHPQVPMIFTTRDLGLGGDLGIEKKLEMQPLTEPQMKAFIRAYYVPDQAEAMLRQLNDRLREFGQTPLLLWMLCEVFQQSPNRQMPTNLAEVFRAFTTMYEDSSVRKHEVALLKGDVRPLSDRRLWKDALKALAALMMQGETPVDFRVAIHRTEAERELGKLFANEKFPARDILDDLLKYHLLQNRTTDQLEFRHQLIQEYYTAEHLLDLLPELSDDQLKRDYLNLLKWTEPIALLLALLDDEVLALRVVKLAMYEVDLTLGSRFAGKVKIPLQTKTIDWINNLNLPIGLKVNCWAISHSEAALNSLLNVLEHQDSDIRRRAAKALTKLGSEGAISGLLKALQDQDSAVRWSAAKTLGEMGNEGAIGGLLKALQDQDSAVRWRVAEALGNLGSEAAISDLLQTLQDQDYQVRRRAAEALGKLGNEAAISALLKALEDRDFYVRSRAAEALGNLGNEVAIDGLLKALEHLDPDVRRRAAVALGNLGSAVAIDGLIEALEDHDLDVRRRAASALGKLDGKAALSGLLKALEDQDPDIRRRAASALGKLDSKAALSGLLKALEDQDPDIRRRAASALEKLDSKATIDGLLKALEDHNSDVRVRKRAVTALGKIGNEAAISSLLNALEDHDSDVGWRAAVALGNLGNQAALGDLLKALQHPSLYVRWRTADALGKLGHEAALANLWQAYFREPEHSFEKAISAIQNRCKFYSYEIWVSQLTAHKINSKSDASLASTTIIQSVDKLIIMNDKAPIFNQQNATIGVNYAAEGSQQDVTQYIHAPEQNFEILLTGYKHFIDELHQQNPNITDEAAIIQTIDTEARCIDTRWQNFLNLKRLWDGGKKAAIKVGEHFVESNPWGKGAIAFLEGVSEDVK